MPAPEKAKQLLYCKVLPLLSRLPRAVAYPLATAAGRLFFRKNEPDWQAAYAKGLQSAFPTATRQELHHWTQSHFGMLAREALDVFYLPHMRRDNLSRFVSLSAPELLADTSAAGKIIVMAHQGRPIMLSSALGLSGLKVGMLSQVIDERNPHLDPTTRQFLNLKMSHTVRIAGGRWVTTADHLRVLYDAIKQGETIIIMMDLVEPDASRQVALPFHGGTLRLPPGILRIAQRGGAKLYFGRATDHGTRAHCSVVPLSQDPHQAMLEAVKLLEADTRQQPWQWWQWNDFHLLWTPT